MNKENKSRHHRPSEPEHIQMPDQPEPNVDAEASSDQVWASDSEHLCQDMPGDVADSQVEILRLEQEVADFEGKYLRTLADFDNFRRRQREEAARKAALAKEGMLVQLLAIVDNFDRAVRSAEAGHDYDSLVEGVSLTLRQMTDMLRREGVESIEAEGQEFNPELHEAVMSDASGQHPEHTVIEQFEKGYTLNGMVLRPARVRVAVSE